MYTVTTTRTVDDEWVNDAIWGSGVCEPWWIEFHQVTDNSVRVTCWDGECGDGEETIEVTVSYQTIISAINRILNGEAEWYIKDYINRDDIDSDAADVILQYAVYGETVYG